MEQTACVDIQALPLQLLLRAHADWRHKPAVVVDRDKPQGVILWVNREAHARRILPGMRYAAGLALARDLRGGCVDDAAIDAAVETVLQRLWSFSPQIEPAAAEPGVFWLNASGLSPIFPSLRTWAASIREDLLEEHLRAVVGVGFSRFGSYAAAKASGRNVLFGSLEEEQRHIRRIPIERILRDANLRDTLLKLGVVSLGQFIDLPAEGIRKRFGAEAEALHALARGAGWTPLQPREIFEPVELHTDFDWPEEKVERLMLRLGRMLQDALAELARRHEILNTAEIALLLDNGLEQHERIAPAAPTRDRHQILLLIRLRMERIELPAGVCEMILRAEGVPIVEGQLEMFREARRSYDDAQRAFATIRAEFGNDAVLCAELQAGHLPEAQYDWKRLETLGTPQPARDTTPGLVRRIYTPAVQLPPRERHEPDGWMVAGLREGPVEEVLGPYYVSGGWWRREKTRAYHYVRTRSGRWFWIYRDEIRNRWFLHGEVQ